MKAQIIFEKLEKLLKEKPDLEVFGVLFENNGIKVDKEKLVCMSMDQDQNAAIKSVCKIFEG